MNWYRLLYDSPSGAKNRPDKPEPTGWKRLPYIFFRQIWNLIGLNILFWAFCLPIVTIPSALKAMTRVCVSMLEGESIDLFHVFWKSFREGFFRTTVVGLGLALLLWAVGTGLWLCAGAMVSNGLFAAPAMLLDRRGDDRDVGFLAVSAAGVFGADHRAVPAQCGFADACKPETPFGGAVAAGCTVRGIFGLLPVFHSASGINFAVLILAVYLLCGVARNKTLRI